MWTKLFCIYDVRAELCIGPIQEHNNDASAIRMFNDIARAEGTTVNQHLEDYNLVYVGEFNKETGELHTAGINLGFPIDNDGCIILRGSTLREVMENATQERARTDAAETAATLDHLNRKAS